MTGAREVGEVASYPVDGTFTADDSGYVLEAKQDGSSEVQHVTGDSSAVVGVNFVSTENQKENVVNPDSGEVDVAKEGRAFPVKADSAEYFVGEDVHLSATNDGHVNKSDTGNYRVGTVARYNDLTSDGDKLLVDFSTD